MYKLCTAEKPSVASDIARVVGATERKDGYFIGNGYIVTWAVGHLVGLAEPAAYGYMSQEQMYDKENPSFKEQAYNELPLLPEAFKLVVLPSTKDQFEIVKGLMHRQDVSLIIDCGDMGAEGHILQWLIRQKAGCTKPVKRFCATSMTDDAIRQAMENLRDIEDYQLVVDGEFCKKKADWILGMSLSRAAAIKYNARIDVGRVLSPTLYFVVRRFLALQNFKVSEYYQLEARFENGLIANWKKAEDGSNYFPVEALDSDRRLLDKEAASKMADYLLKLGDATVTKFNAKRRAEERPQLYDITELQRDGNRKHGYSAAKVLECAQALYEKHKILTYPRTDSRYITQFEAALLPKMIEDIATLPYFNEQANGIITNGMVVDARIVNDAKVTDHHALVVTEKIRNFDLDILDEAEKNILILVLCRILVSLSPKYEYDETTFEAMATGGFSFKALAHKPVNKGWKEVQAYLYGEDETIEEENTLPNDIAVGQKIGFSNISVVPQKTTPPKLHTEASLLTAMENAGSHIENGEILKGKGIGTQATRAAIIQGLKDKGYIAEQGKGKVKNLVPTKQGVNIIRILPPELYTPKITADWEMAIAEIVAGNKKPVEFMAMFEAFVKAVTQKVKDTKVEGIDFSREKEIISSCPWCGHNIVMGQNGCYCDTKECKFSIYEDNQVFTMRTGRKLSKSQIKRLAEKGSITAKCKSKNNATYDGCFTVAKSPKGYVFLDFSFVNKTKGKKGG